ncbi:hypothetical protein JAAARDRAFT_134026 [Jaapia argillacea MUCL 33604]|uniref:Uncharacterized protein n=1 Tax=Jaapia argillacea MUCL 33604 TaxID=933084 RepID=A0A067PKA0_9AGAM|nr:hypothetical protein JAAARDRAFT_134026 [Jaapia argillacea MUCL 33604]
MSKGRPVVIHPWFGDTTEPTLSWMTEWLDRQFMTRERDIVWQDTNLISHRKSATDSKVALISDAKLRALDWNRIEESESPSPISITHDNFWSPRSQSIHRGRKSDGTDEFLQSSKIHYYGKLAQFFSTIHQPEFCGNLLDMYSMDMQRPWIVNIISGHARAAVETEKRNYDIQQPKGKPIQTMFKTPDKTSFDYLALNEWKLVTSLGFPTLTHEDAGGFTLWIRMRLRMKIWGIARPKADAQPHDPGTTTTACLRATEAILNMEKFEEHVDLFVIFLTPGSLL